MSKFLAGLGVLCVASHIHSATAQTAGSSSIESLYGQGQQEMAANWRGLGKAYNAAEFIQKDTRKSSNGHLTVWRHREFPYAEYIEKEKPYLSMRERMVVDCKAGTLGVSDTSYHAGRFGSGAVLAVDKVKNVEMTEALPDSLEEHLIKTVCAPKPRSKPTPKPKKPADDKKAADDKAAEKKAQEKKAAEKKAETKAESKSAKKTPVRRIYAEKAVTEKGASPKPPVAKKPPTKTDGEKSAIKNAF